MGTALMNRIGNWFGTWRGSVQLPGKEPALLEVVVAPIFNGEAAEIRSTTVYVNSGKTMSAGYALLAIGSSGRIDQVMFSQRLGFCKMRGVDDDEDVVSFEGRLAGNLNLHISMHIEEGEFVIVHRVREGYAVGNVPSETASRLRRVDGSGRE